MVGFLEDREVFVAVTGWFFKNKNVLGGGFGMIERAYFCRTKHGEHYDEQTRIGPGETSAIAGNDATFNRGGQDTGQIGTRNAGFY